MALLDAVPCSDSSSCYAITQPKALNQGYVLSKNGSGVWVRADGYKLMQQSAYNNQYLNVSDNVALLAIGNFSGLGYYTAIQQLTYDYRPAYYPLKDPTNLTCVVCTLFNECAFYDTYYAKWMQPTTGYRSVTTVPYILKNSTTGYSAGSQMTSYIDSDGIANSVRNIIKYTLIQ